MNLNDTIAAISTPPGKGGVALIRISGDEALSIADRTFRPRSGKRLSDLAARTAIYGDILTKEPDGSLVRIDDGIATVFRAPASYTGEDTVEICCHGGALITREVLSAVLAAGARQADAGEFTRRAHISGRLGLSAAEALATLLDAKTHEQLKLSRSGLDGALSRKTSELYSELRRLVSDVYARVDFPEEDLAGLSRDELTEGVRQVEAELRHLMSTYRTGHAISEGISTVLCGATNSGKSSLYNALLGKDAAIVTDIAGTTRDILEDTVSFGGVTLRLCDTAGLRESEDTVERIGIERAREKVESAELVIALFDTSRELTEQDTALLGYLDGLISPVIILETKSDLPARASLPGKYSAIRVSTKTGEGLEALAARINSLFIDGNINISTDAVAATARQYAALSRAADAVSGALAALDAGLPEDIAGSDIELAMSALAEIDGREVTADIVSEIFSRFCVGK
ncbi:MAG: tRNA uridine-5-carboxymethylaminomethyl(34) synthesis GTPase MnmE [Clostridia bacterium]|nr:tRNA uridine-5-carboxymethylaminomethyl(34) synthesis GTPase MnmE [Clostridia bacterium]